MPYYTFKNTETGELSEYVMSISEMLQFKENNPHMQQELSAPKLIGGMSMDSGRLSESWKDNLREMKKKHPLSSGIDHLI